MPENRKLDPFKPAQPQIPGVPVVTAEKEQPDTGLPSPAAPPASHPVSAWAFVLPASIAVMIALAIAGSMWLWRAKSLPKSDPSVSVNVDLPTLNGGIHQSAAGLPVGPGIVASTAELARPWASKRFLFRGPLSNEPIPAMVVRLPGGEYWAFSLQEPFGTCELEYVTDLGKLAAEYGFHANHPMVGDPCTHTVFDLLQYSGGAPDGGLVRGAIVHGTAIRPPMAIEIAVKGSKVRAVRME